MIITSGAVEPLRHVLKHLRSEDREEIVAARGELDPEVMAFEITRLPWAWIAWRRDTGEPVAAWGAHRMTPACVGCFAFATPAWRRVVRPVTRHIRDVMIPTLLRAGFHRAECRALASRRDTHRWLTGFGWQAEAVLSGFGVRRENFILFAWTADGGTSQDHD